MTASLLTDIDHVGIAVADLDAATAWYQRMFGASVSWREAVEADGVEETMLAAGGSFVQLLTPMRDDSPVARFLASRGEGVHHVAYRVADVAHALRAYRQAGGTSIDTQPRPGGRGTTVAFLHPKAAWGTLIELVERH